MLTAPATTTAGITRAPLSGPGPRRTEIWADDTIDGYGIERVDGRGTRWAVLHQPTGVWAVSRYDTLADARHAITDGTLTWYDPTHPLRTTTGPTPPAHEHEEAAA